MEDGSDNGSIMERKLAELEALQAIYEGSFSVTNADEQLLRAVALDQPVDVTVNVTSVNGSLVFLSCRLPPGYPVTEAAQVLSVSVPGWTNGRQQQLKLLLQRTADRLLGQETIMEIIHELNEVILVAEEESNCSTRKTQISVSENTCSPRRLARCWIWAHHITNTDRRKSIVQEARNHNLGGFLKSGYPGIVVIEGENCQEFVNWLKGSKSRPGGFGRNWGHHVRGEIDLGCNSSDGCASRRRLPLEFTELDDMGKLGGLCKKFDLEDEFLEYVMQHK